MLKNVGNAVENAVGEVGCVKARMDTRLMTRIGLLAALSLVFLLVVPRVALVPAAPYLQYDMADVPILLAGFLLGVGPGFWVLGLVSLFQGLILGENGLVGAFMHFCSTGALLWVSCTLAAHISGNKGKVLGLLAGSIMMMLVMVPLNLLVTVYIFGQPQEIVVAALLPGIMPFNLLKALINSAVFFCIYAVNEKFFTGLIER